MTKESLEQLLVDYGVSFTSALADRLLQEFNPEICEDTISRQAALEKIHWLGLDNDTTIKCDLAIRALSSVNTQEPKTVFYSGDGYADGYMVYDMAECPNCGYEYEEGDKDWGLPFCPNCGQLLIWESEGAE